MSLRKALELAERGIAEAPESYRIVRDRNAALEAAITERREQLAEASGSVGAVSLRVYTDGFDKFVAESADDAKRMSEELHGGECWNGFSALPDDSTLTIHDADDTGARETLTCAEWVKLNGPGFLCSTEY